MVSAIFVLIDFIYIGNELGYDFGFKSRKNSNNVVEKIDVESEIISDDKDNTQVIDDGNVIEDNGVVIHDDEIKNTVESIMEKYFNNIFDMHSTKFCGDLNRDDVYGDYVNVIKYNSIESLKNDYKMYLSEEYIDKYIIGFFAEHDNKLYCRPRHSAPYTYEADSFEVVSMKENGNGITATGFYRTEDSGLYPMYTFDVNLNLVYNDDGYLVLADFSEEMRKD